MIIEIIIQTHSQKITLQHLPPSSVNKTATIACMKWTGLAECVGDDVKESRSKAPFGTIGMYITWMAWKQCLQWNVGDWYLSGGQLCMRKVKSLSSQDTTTASQELLHGVPAAGSPNAEGLLLAVDKFLSMKWNTQTQAHAWIAVHSSDNLGSSRSRSAATPKSPHQRHATCFQTLNCRRQQSHFRSLMPPPHTHTI